MRLLTLAETGQVPRVHQRNLPDRDPGGPVTACQRWRDRQDSWCTWAGGFDRDRYTVTEIGDDTGPKRFIERHHYLGSYPNARYRYGLYDTSTAVPALVGVAVLSVPASLQVLAGPLPGLRPVTESLELGRLVLLDEVPRNAESFTVRRVLRAARDDHGILGVVSFADPNARYDADGTMTMGGHFGICYQAGNARFCGDTGRRTDHVLPDGTVMAPRAEQKIRAQERGHRYAEQILTGFGARRMRAGDDPRAWLRQALREAGAKNVRARGKFRYVFAGAGVTLGLPVRAYPKPPAVAARASSPGGTCW